MAYIDVSKIEAIRFMCHKVLPLVYDESLSYYEVLCKVADKLNVTIEAVNQLDDNVEALANSVNVLNDRVTAIANEINTFEQNVTNRFNALEAAINATVDAKMAEVDDKMAEVDSKLADALHQIDLMKAELQEYVERTVAELTEQVNRAIQEALDTLDQRFRDFDYEMRVYIKAQLQAYLDQIPEITSVIVWSPLSGKQEPIQKVIDDLYWKFNINALDCYEFDHLELTCGQLDKFMVHFIPRGLTVWEWMNKAKEWVWVDHKLKMRNFFTGAHGLYKQNVRINNALLKMSGSYTAQEFDTVGISADEYDALELSAYNYDWHSNTMVVTE